MDKIFDLYTYLVFLAMTILPFLVILLVICLALSVPVYIGCCIAEWKESQ